MNRRTVALGLVAVFAITGAAAIVLAVSGGDDGDEVAGPKATTTTTAALTDTAQELVDRLATARKRPLHLTYSGNVGTTEEGGKVTVEVWWKGDLTRQTVLVEGPQGRQEQTSLVLEGSNVACQKVQDAPWICQRSASVATAAGKPGGIIDALVSQLNGKDVTAVKAKVGDTDVDCYTLDKGSDDQLCLRSDGVPVRFTLGGSALVVSEIATDVDDAAFTPPAQPSDAKVPPITATTAATPTTTG